MRLLPRLLGLVGALCLAASAVAAGLRNGPMLGAASPTTATVWLQTTEPARVELLYWPEAEPTAVQLSPAQQSTAADAGVVKFLLGELRQGTVYGYRILLDGQPVSPTYREGYAAATGPLPLRFRTADKWRFHPQPNATPAGTRHRLRDFRFAIGSCAYINEPGFDREFPGNPPYGGEYEIFERLAEKQPEVMLWLGDNIYLREGDWETWPGLLHRWSYSRAVPELRAFLAGSVHLALWDDHDFGPNDSSADFFNHTEARRAFQLFWANPPPAQPSGPGLFTFFNWLDVNFYLLDNRSFRSARLEDPRPFGGQRSYLGRAQADWLVSALKWAQTQSGPRNSHPVTWHIVAMGGQALSSPNNPDAWRFFAEEWQYTIDRIVHEGIDNVIFVSGDIHRGEVNRLVYVGGGQPGTPGQAGLPGAEYVFYDVTSSPLTAGVSSWKQVDPLTVSLTGGTTPDTFFTRNFVTFDVKGDWADRRLEIRYWDSAGQLLNQWPRGAPGEVGGHSVIHQRETTRPRPTP